MDPITGIMTAVGLGATLFGSIGSFGIASQEANVGSQEADVSASITGLEEQENNQRQLAMQISARRQQTEIVRQTQLRQAQGLAAGVNQGAQQGSGVAGGQAQAVSEGSFNMLGVNQNLSIGNQIFGLQGQVSGKQIQLAGLESQMAKLQGQGSIDAGIASIGSSLMHSAGPMGNLLGQAFSFGQGSDFSQVLPGGSPLGQGGIGSA